MGAWRASGLRVARYCRIESRSAVKQVELSESESHITSTDLTELSTLPVVPCSANSRISILALCNGRRAQLRAQNMEIESVPHAPISHPFVASSLARASARKRSWIAM